MRARSLLIACIFSTVTCLGSQVKPAARGTLDLETGVYQDQILKLTVPESWEILTGNETDIVIKSPFLNPQDNFQENLTISVFQLTRPFTTAALLEANRNQLRARLPRATWDEHFDLSSQLDWKGIIMHYPLNTDIQMSSLLAVAATQQRAILILATGTATQFDNYRSHFSKIVQSVELRP